MWLRSRRISYLVDSFSSGLPEGYLPTYSYRRSVTSPAERISPDIKRAKDELPKPMFRRRSHCRNRRVQKLRNPRWNHRHALRAHASSKPISSATLNVFFGPAAKLALGTPSSPLCAEGVQTSAGGGAP